MNVVQLDSFRTGFPLLEVLFSQALAIGRVDLFTHDDRTFSAYIKFKTAKGRDLTARSGYHHTTIAEALTVAIRDVHDLNCRYS